jgi:TP901 family phage tail tape measure protein
VANLSSQLIISVVDKVTAPARAITKTVNGLTSQLAENNRRLDAMRGRMVETAAVAYGLFRAIKAPVMAAVEFESAMADVRKVVDFETPEAFAKMGSDIVEMSTRIPIAAKGLAEIVAAAGQAGMAGDELLQFAEMAAKVGVAFDMSSGEVGTALAKIKTQLAFTVGETSALADAINHLSNTSASSAPDIVNYMKRVAATGEIYGFTAEQTAAIGSAMIAAGAEAEVAATSFRNMGRALAKGGEATERQRKAFGRLGLDTVKVAKQFNEDAVGTVRDVLTRINELPEHLRANAISEIFGDEARALAPLVGQIELYDKAIASVAAQANYLGSSQKEYDARAATTANSMQLFANKATAAGIAIGGALLPALNDIMDALGPVIMAAAKFAENNPRLTQTVVALAAGLVALRVASLAARFGLLWMRGGFLSAAIVGLKGVGAAANGTGTALRAMRNAATGGAARRIAVDAAANAKALYDQRQAAFAGAVHMRGLAKAGNVAGLSMADATKAVAATGKEATAARTALAAANTQLRATGPAARAGAAGVAVMKGAMTALKLAIIGTGIGAIVIAIALAGTWIYNNWSGIREMFVGIGEGIKAAFPGAAAAIDTISTAMGTLFGWLGDITGPLDASAEDWRQFGFTIGETIGGIPAAITAFVADFAAAGTAIAKGLVDAVKAAIDGLVNWFAGIPQRIKDAVGRIDLSSLVTWPKMPSLFGGGSEVEAAVAPAIAGHKAMGGPVAAAKTYLVGERGPELFTPRVPGHISTARETATALANIGRGMSMPAPRGAPAMVANDNRAAANSNVAPVVNNTFGDININGSNLTVDQVRREFGREAGALMRRSFSDGGR